MEKASEEWRQAPGWEGIYEVSSLGRVRRVLPEFSTTCGRIMKLYRRRTGYSVVHLRFRGRNKNALVHRLVAKAFIPASTPERFCVNHKDGNRSNNVLGNLEWCTVAENNRHAVEFLGRSGKSSPGASNGNAKLTKELVDYIRARYARGDVSQQFIADSLNVSQSIVSRIIRRVNWIEEAA